MKIIFALLLTMALGCSNNNKIAEIKQQTADSAISWKLHNDSLDHVNAALEKEHDSLVNDLIRYANALVKQNDSLFAATDSLKANYWVAKYALARLKKRIKIFRGNPSQLIFSKSWYNRIVEPVDKKLIMP